MSIFEAFGICTWYQLLKIFEDQHLHFLEDCFARNWKRTKERKRKLRVIINEGDMGEKDRVELVRRRRTNRSKLVARTRLRKQVLSDIYLPT